MRQVFEEFVCPMFFIRAFLPFLEDTVMEDSTKILIIKMSSPETVLLYPTLCSDGNYLHKTASPVKCKLQI